MKNKWKPKEHWKEYKQVKFTLSTWKKLRRMYPAEKNETFVAYLERVANHVIKTRSIVVE